MGAVCTAGAAPGGCDRLLPGSVTGGVGRLGRVWSASPVREVFWGPCGGRGGSRAAGRHQQRARPGAGRWALGALVLWPVVQAAALLDCRGCEEGAP
jgi:hypothetical protein